MRFFEYRNELIMGQHKVQERLNLWGKEGWEVLSVIVPDPSNYSTYAVTAKREIISQRTPSTGRKFR